MARSQAILDTLEAKQMQQLVHFPTHVKGNILDLIITNSSDRVINVEEGGRLGRSDHFIINMTVAAEKRAATAGAPRYDWSRANIRNIREELRAREWQMNNETSIEDDWQEFKNAILATTMKNVPVFKMRTNIRPKWLSREIMKLIRQKKAMWKEVKYHNAGQQLEEYKKIEKQLAKKIRNAKRSLEKELAFGEDKRGKKFSNYVKSWTKARTGIGPLKTNDGEITTDGKKMANLLNDYFVSVFSTEDTVNLPVKERETGNVLENISFERAEILKTLKNLKQNAAPGPDGISPRVLREARFEIVDSMQQIFRKSINPKYRRTGK
jgi:hypothetical protein